MKQIFEIEIKEELARVESIEADTLDEAIDIAMERYHDQKVILDAEDMKDVSFLPFEKGELERSEERKR